MIKSKLDVKGLDDLIRDLEKLEDLTPIKEILETETKNLERDMYEHANYTRGYATGETKESIYSFVDVENLIGMAGPTTEQAIYVENGTPDMSPQPVYGPAHQRASKKLIKRLTEVME